MVKGLADRWGADATPTFIRLYERWADGTPRRPPIGCCGAALPAPS